MLHWLMLMTCLQRFLMRFFVSRRCIYTTIRGLHKCCIDQKSTKTHLLRDKNTVFGTIRRSSEEIDLQQCKTFAASRKRERTRDLIILPTDENSCSAKEVDASTSSSSMSDPGKHWTILPPQLLYLCTLLQVDRSYLQTKSQKTLRDLLRLWPLLSTAQKPTTAAAQEEHDSTIWLTFTLFSFSPTSPSLVSYGHTEKPLDDDGADVEGEEALALIARKLNDNNATRGRLTDSFRSRDTIFKTGILATIPGQRVQQRNLFFPFFLLPGSLCEVCPPKGSQSD